MNIVLEANPLCKVIVVEQFEATHKHGKIYDYASLCMIKISLLKIMVG